MLVNELRQFSLNCPEYERDLLTLGYLPGTVCPRAQPSEGSSPDQDDAVGALQQL